MTPSAVDDIVGPFANHKDAGPGRFYLLQDVDFDEMSQDGSWLVFPHLQTPETSYFVLGSFRSPYIRRRRVVENELNKRIGTYAFVLGDLRDINIDQLPTFLIRFYIVAPYADVITAVYEQDAGGEGTELGKISETPFFEDSYVLPRDYAWMTDRQLDHKETVFAAGIRIHEHPVLSDDEVENELERLVENARTNGVVVSIDEVKERIEERRADGPDVTS